jgi:Ca2+-binding RTX toxin-like protein
MNLTGVTYWSTSEPFIDRFKTSATWKSNATGTTVAMDGHGDPLAIPAGATNISTNFAVDPLSAGTDNNYVLTFDGTAAIRLNGVKIISSDPGKIVFQVTNANSTYVGMSVTSMSTTDPLHDIHIVRADQVDLFNAGEIFNPAFIDKVSHWDTLRFMGWENTNTLSQVNWDTHSTITNATWNTSAAPDGVPIEVMVKLANEAHTDMWYNVPTTADDTYVTNALSYIRDNLDPALKVHVEYSNEVWNWSYDAADYSQAKANALWGTDVNHDGVIDNTNTAEKVQGGWMVYYGYRSAQVASIAHDVFGDEAGARLDTVLATQAVNPALTTHYTIPGIARADVGSPGDLFTEYAIAPYFGSEFSRPATAADKATVLAWAHSGEAGIDAAFNELEHGGSLSTDHSLASFAAFYASQGAIAQQYGMDLVAYEAGASLTTAVYSGQDRIDVNAFFGKLLNDPRAGELYTQMIHDFTAAGGTLLTAMNETGTNGTSGYWGVLDTIYDTSSPRYDALVAAAADAHSLETDTGGHETDPGGLDTDAPIVDPTSSLINGTSGDDTLTGTDGDDILNGATGADHMIGGAGNDVYTVDNAGDTIVENLNGGIDTVTTSLDHYTLGNNVENLIFVGSDHIVGTGNKLDNVITAGSGDAMLSGLAGNDSLMGGAGNDTLDGGTGSDSLAGGQGNDTYIVDNAGDHVVEAVGSGTDTVITTLDAYTLTDNVENLTHSGSRAFAGTGNALDNVITSGDGRGTLLGLDGNDTLIGSAGADYLDGGAGNDSMSGGGGNDVYIVDSIGDTVTEAVNGGIDEIRTTLDSLTLGANVERLTAIGTGSFTGTGNALDNVLTAGSGPAHLYGLAGNDTLNGGNGDDYLDGGSGADRMIFIAG